MVFSNNRQRESYPMTTTKKRKLFLDYITPAIRSLAIPIGTIVPDPKNARAHNERNIEVICNSLKEHGQDTPIVIEKGTNLLIKGHGRLMAAKLLGWTHIAAVAIEPSSATSRMSRSLVDNQSASLATWDYDSLMSSLNQLVEEDVDIEKIGFSQEDLVPLLAAQDNKQEEEKPKKKNPPPIKLTWDQRSVFDSALSSMREEYGAEISEGRVLELICADFLSGRGYPQEDNLFETEE